MLIENVSPFHHHHNPLDQIHPEHNHKTFHLIHDNQLIHRIQDRFFSFVKNHILPVHHNDMYFHQEYQQ